LGDHPPQLATDDPTALQQRELHVRAKVALGLRAPDPVLGLLQFTIGIRQLGDKMSGG
jgi:hypothetical protein